MKVPVSQVRVLKVMDFFLVGFQGELGTDADAILAAQLEEEHFGCILEFGGGS